jgi:hypothetical protein
MDQKWTPSGLVWSVLSVLLFAAGMSLVYIHLTTDNVVRVSILRNGSFPMHKAVKAVELYHLAMGKR